MVDLVNVAGRVSEHREVAPRARLRESGPGDGYFYPREVTAILGLHGIDYRQLRQLHTLVRDQAGLPHAPAEEWARFSLLDMAATIVAIRLALRDSIDRPRRGRRMQLGPVRRACMALREAGYANPLLDVPMERAGRTVFALVNGELVDPTTGQIALDLSSSQARAVTFDQAVGFMKDRAMEDPELLARLTSDSAPSGSPVQRPAVDRDPSLRRAR